MEVAFERRGNTLLILASGRVDAQSVPVFDVQAAPQLAVPQPKILFDLAAVSIARLRSVLHLLKHAAAHGGRLAVGGAQPNIMEVIELSGFPALLDLYPDHDSALALPAS